jgi:hypothetical protein
MSQDLISVIDAARQIGKRKQAVFKILKRLGIETQKLRGSDAQGQIVSYITQEEFQLLLISASSSSDAISDGLGELQRKKCPVITS